MVLLAASHVDSPVYDGWIWIPADERKLQSNTEVLQFKMKQMVRRTPKSELDTTGIQLWQRLHHSDGESAESDSSMESTRQVNHTTHMLQQ